MTSDETTPLTIEKSKPYIYLLFVYFTAIGILYLWGYWSTFDINILEYMSLSDIIRTSASSIILLLIPYAFMAYIFLPHKKTDQIPSTKVEKNKIQLFFIKYSFALYIAAFTALSIYQATISSAFYLLGPAFLLIAVSVHLNIKNHLNKIIYNSDLGWLLIYSLFMLPLAAYAEGNSKAENIIKGKNYEYIISKSPEDKSNRLIGHAGNFIFFFNPSNQSVLITKIQDGQTLNIKHHPSTQT